MNCQHEPPYPGLNTVVMSIRYPERTAHKPTALCVIEAPHLTRECGEWAEHSIHATHVAFERSINERNDLPAEAGL